MIATKSDEGQLIELRKNRRRHLQSEHRHLTEHDRLLDHELVVKQGEDEVVSWFRGWHSMLTATLVNEFTDTQGLDSAHLLHELPRHRPDLREHLNKSSSLPVAAFKDGSALDMVCYLALQALPRHSRVYSNVYLAGKWHEMLELQAVQTVAPLYSSAAGAATKDAQAKKKEE